MLPPCQHYNINLITLYFYIFKRKPLERKKVRERASERASERERERVGERERENGWERKRERDENILFYRNLIKRKKPLIIR